VRFSLVKEMKFRAIPIFHILTGIFTAVSLYSCATTNPQITDEIKPVNFVKVSDRLVTSGQPSISQIARLDSLQYRLVINLAPIDGGAKYLDEAYLLGKMGIAYTAIPVDIHRPQYRDFALFSNILNSVEKENIWVHCQVNHRASLFAFLYRVIHEGADLDRAYEKVSEVWVPTPNWLNFANETLAKHNITYDF